MEGKDNSKQKEDRFIRAALEEKKIRFPDKKQTVHIVFDNSLKIETVTEQPREAELDELIKKLKYLLWDLRRTKTK